MLLELLNIPLTASSMVTTQLINSAVNMLPEAINSDYTVTVWSLCSRKKYGQTGSSVHEIH